MAEEKAKRTANRVITIRYTTVPEEERGEHWNTCLALARAGIVFQDWKGQGATNYGQPDVGKLFLPEIEVEESKVLQYNGVELVADDWGERKFAEKVYDWLEECGVEADLTERKVEVMKEKRHAGGSSDSIWVHWSDMGGDYENAYTLSLYVRSDEDDEQGAIARVRFGACNTRTGHYRLSISGPHWCLDSIEVKDAVEWVLHRLDLALKPQGFADPEFDCAVELHYSRKEACDVGWLARKMLAGDEEE